MFFVVVGTRPRCIINEFAWAARINIFIFRCHTVTKGLVAPWWYNAIFFRTGSSVILNN